MQAYKRVGVVVTLGVMFLMGISLRAGAQETQNTNSMAGPLTLEQAVRLALNQNPALRATLDTEDAMRARLNQVRAAWFPKIDVHQDFTRGNNPVYVFGSKLMQRQFRTTDFALNKLNTPTPLDNFQTRLDGQWMLFDSGQTLFQQRSAKRLVTGADFEMEQARQDLILEVVRSYYGVLVLRESAQASDRAFQTAEASAQRIESMHKAGLVVDSDFLSAKVFVAQMKDRQIRAHNDVALAEMQLARQMGMPLDSSVEPAGKLAEPVAAPRTIQDWTHTAFEERPVLRAAQLQQDAMEQDRKARVAEFGPKFALFGGVERDAMALGGPSGTNWTAGARLDFNVFAGGAQRARVAEAAAMTSKAKHDVEWLRAGVQMEVRKAYLDANAASQRADAARSASEQARDSLRIVQNRYEAGLTTLTELLRAQTAQLDATTGYLAAVQDWQVANAQLERAAGVLTPGSELIRGSAVQP